MVGTYHRQSSGGEIREETEEDRKITELSVVRE